MIFCRLTPSGPEGGGAILPPRILAGPQAKLEKPVTLKFLAFPKYVHTLTSKKEKNLSEP